MVQTQPKPDIRIVAALCWYDEPEEFLERLVGSLAAVCDELVAFDGRWDLMPGTRAASPRSQRRALERHAAAAQLPLRLTEPRSAWRSQVEKRDALMVAAGERGDWLLVIDGDEYVGHVDASGLRRTLAGAAADVAQVQLRTLNRRWPHSELGPMLSMQRRLFRAGTRMSGPAHNCYRRGATWLGGDPAQQLVAAALDLAAVLTIDHDNNAREHERRRASQSYRRARRAANVEVYA